MIYQNYFSQIIESINQAKFKKADELIISNKNQLKSNIKQCLQIAKSFLYFGEIYRARTVFNLLQNIPRDKDYENIKWEIEDSEETILIGESVYPPGVHPNERWNTIPSCIPSGLRDKLSRFYPGRITAIYDDKIVCVFCSTKDKRIICIELSIDKWVSTMNLEIPKKEEYIVLAIFENEKKIYLNKIDDPEWLLK